MKNDAAAMAPMRRLVYKPPYFFDHLWFFTKAGLMFGHSTKDNDRL